MNCRSQWLSFVFLQCLALTGCSNGEGTPEPIAPPLNATFALPGTVVVNTDPYTSVAEAVDDAINVDWIGDPAKASAVRLGYAARELSQHLALLGVDVEFAQPSEATRSNELFLILRGDPASEALLAGTSVDYSTIGEQGFEIGWVDQNVYVTATTPTGILHGVYRLLEHIGFAWYVPGETSAPDTDTDPIRWTRIRQNPRVELRGFWIFGEQLLPDEYTIWLARNRLNIAAGAAPYLRKMIGIKEWGGGHDLLQQEFSAPGLFEQHPEWYSIINGVRRPVAATGVYFNPAFGNADAANFFADRMIDRLANGDLSDVDVLNIWPSDSRSGRFDQSALALSIGNETDNLLTFYGNVALRFRQAYSNGLLNRPVYVGGISYYQTWKPPTNQNVIDILEDADYLHVFYLNERSWSGSMAFNLDNREANRILLENLADWQLAASFEYGFVEYYNYSIYAALALNDFEYLAENYKTLTANGSSLFAYMHPLLLNPGPRRLTNELLAKLGWEDLDASDADRQAYIEQVTDAYFARRYAQYASEWREVYSIMAGSVDNASEIFGLNSLYWLVFQDMIWADPPYTAAEVVNFMSLYRNGGVQDLPTFPARGFLRADFRGLDESIQMQDDAAASWQAILAQPLATEVRAAMESDIAWFEATRGRYRLMALTADFVVSQFNGSDLSGLREQIRTEVTFLETSPTTNDTISPVDQRAFLAFHRSLAGIE